MKKSLLLSALIVSSVSASFAEASYSRSGVILATPQPTTCITPTFTKSGSSSWVNISLTLTNHCGIPVDFQNSTITFNTSDNLNGVAFWGNFLPLSYPDNTLQLLAQKNTSGGYLTSINLHFPEESWANTILQNNQTFTLLYGSPAASYDPTSVKVYVTTNQPPVQNGEIDLTNTTTQPAQVSQTFAIVDLVNSSNQTTKVQVPWNSLQPVRGLAPGVYNIQAESLTDSQGNIYQGTAQPTSVTVSANQKVASKISYTEVIKTGSIKVQVPALPAAILGYAGSPSITFKRNDTGATLVQTLPWNTTTTVSKLANNLSYSLSTPSLSYNGNNCTGSFNPVTLTSSAQTPPTSQLTFQCMPVPQAKIPITINGLPNTINSLALTFTPNNQMAPVSATINIANGTGTGTVNLTEGVIYTVSTASVSGYTATFTPQPLTATSAATETISFKQASTNGGRIIGYLPGWETPPSATALASAGYTHILVAFGVFSTTTPGQIANAFSTISQSYIASLHQAGIKVSLSIGGASSSLPNTTVNFNQVVSAASSPAAFQATFVQSLEAIIAQYGFDGVDFDIEQGFNAGGTFTAPQGNIAVLAAAINQLHKDNPNLLISLAPQVANISATSGFDATWGNYASLVMQTAPSLSWVGIQMYNTGCAFGIDQVCYDPNATSSPNFSVAMATDLLANWPKTTASGQATGFQPYISYLNPSQVVIGFPSPDAQGNSDGAPVTPTSTIKRAIQCLRTAAAGSGSCDSYIPPKAYPGIGGVFDWEVIHDQSNSFKFASDLKACVINGNCS